MKERVRDVLKGMGFVLIVMAVIAVVVLAVAANAADAVEPATLTFTNTRADAQAYASSEYYYEATTLRLTNCVAQTTNAIAQGLDSVTVEVRVGTTVTNIAYTGTVQVATGGVWDCDVTIPSDLATTYIQTKLTDNGTNIYIYPWKMLRTKQPLE